MGLRHFLILCFAALAAAALGAIGVGVWLIESRLPPETAAEVRDIVIVYGGGIGVTAGRHHRACSGRTSTTPSSQPLSAIVRGIQTVVHAKSDYRIEIEEAHQLDGLPGAVNELIRAAGARADSVNEAIDKATASIEHRRTSSRPF